MEMIKRLDFKGKNGAGEMVNAYAIRPTRREINEADLIYKSKYSEAVRLGTMTGAEAERLLTERSVFTTEDTQKLAELYMKLAEAGQKLKTEGKDLTKGSSIVYEMDQTRLEIMRLNSKRNNVLDNTAEAYADEQRIQYFLLSCTYNADTDERLWAGFEDYIKDGESDIANLAMKNVIYLVANEGRDFRRDWPEYEWRLEHGLVDEDTLEPLPNADRMIQEAFESSKKDAKKKTAKKKTTKKKTTRKKRTNNKKKES